MKEQFNIGEISRLLHIPTATLRFWEDSGLFSIEKQANHYRTYNTRDIIQIADVMFYRTLGIPVSQVREMELGSRTEYAGHLKTMQSHIEDELEKYQKMKEKVERQLSHVAEVERLTQVPYIPEDIPFDTVISFDYLEADKLMGYIDDPSRYVRYIDTHNMSTETRGIIADPTAEHTTLLWKKKANTAFLTFLIREKVNKDYESDLEQSLSKIRLHYHTGCLLAQYFMTAMEDGEVVDYLKAYLEVRPL